MSFWNKKSQEGLGSVENKSLDKKSEVKAPVQNLSTDKENPIQNSAPASSLVANNSSDNSYNKVRSALSAGTVIQGKLSFDTPVRIDGKLSGEVYSSKVLIVGETAQISADIEASSLVIMGKIKGTIKATEKVQLCAGADVEANITSPSLIIESGAKFNGSSDMSNLSALSINNNDAKSTKKPETDIYSNDNIDLGQMMNKGVSNKKAIDKKPEVAEVKAESASVN